MSVIGIIVCCLITGMVFILVAPIVLITQFSSLPGNRNGIFLVHWIHPWIARATYRFGSGIMELRLFGWRGSFPGGQQAPAPDVVPDNRQTGISKTVAPEPAATTGRSKGPSEKSDTRIPQSPETRSKHKEKKGPRVGNDPAIPPAPNRLTWSNVKKTIAVLRQGRSGGKLFRWVLRVLRFTLKIVRFDHLRLTAKAGVEDPAETGKLYGYFTALHSVLFSNRKNMDVRLEPRFMSNVLEFEGSVGLKSSIAAVVMPMVVALVTFPYISVFFVWRRLKKIYTVSGSVQSSKA
jgi:hypothetical protein